MPSFTKAVSVALLLLATSSAASAIPVAPENTVSTVICIVDGVSVPFMNNRALVNDIMFPDASKVPTNTTTAAYIAALKSCIVNASANDADLLKDIRGTAKRFSAKPGSAAIPHPTSDDMKNANTLIDYILCYLNLQSCPAASDSDKLLGGPLSKFAKANSQGIKISLAPDQDSENSNQDAPKNDNDGNAPHQSAPPQNGGGNQNTEQNGGQSPPQNGGNAPQNDANQNAGQNGGNPPQNGGQSPQNGANQNAGQNGGNPPPNGGQSPQNGGNQNAGQNGQDGGGQGGGNGGQNGGNGGQGGGNPAPNANNGAQDNGNSGPAALGPFLALSTGNDDAAVDEEPENILNPVLVEVKNARRGWFF